MRSNGLLCYAYLSPILQVIVGEVQFYHMGTVGGNLWFISSLGDATAVQDKHFGQVQLACESNVGVDVLASWNCHITIWTRGETFFSQVTRWTFGTVFGWRDSLDIVWVRCGVRYLSPESSAGWSEPPHLCQAHGSRESYPGCTSQWSPEPWCGPRTPLTHPFCHPGVFHTNTFTQAHRQTHNTNII